MTKTTNTILEIIGIIFIILNGIVSIFQKNWYALMGWLVAFCGYMALYENKKSEDLRTKK